jgi:hypothetical protein
VVKLTNGRVFTTDMIYHDRSHHQRDYVNETCCLKYGKGRSDSGLSPVRGSLPLTRLEYQGASDIHIPAIAQGFYTLVCAYQRAYDESSGLADTIERSELDGHGGR